MTMQRLILQYLIHYSIMNHKHYLGTILHNSCEALHAGVYNTYMEEAKGLTVTTCIITQMNIHISIVNNICVNIIQTLNY